MPRLLLLCLSFLVTWLSCPTAGAHGFAGKRFFPATLAIDDPAVSDEADMLVSQSWEPDAGGPTSIRGLNFEFAKRMTPRFGLSVGETWLNLSPAQGPSANGFDNLALGAKYLLAVNPTAESIYSIGLDVDTANTGSKGIDADTFSTVTPSLFFGKGFGGLESHPLLRPLALTGAIGVSYPGDRTQADRFNWGFTLQYNLNYLQSFVKDEGFGNTVNHLIPILEIPMQTCLDHGCSGQTTGTINPGVIWFSNWGQLAFEATVPINHRSGSRVGFLLQLHFYLDDVFPHSIGKPIME